jgi:phage shock protein PspC (stress-responsive transcriptional regulator)
VDVTLIRVAWVVALFCFGTGLIAYLVASIIMPNEEVPARHTVVAN